MSIRGKRVFITGATGFIGSRLVERLVEEHGCKVRALVHKMTSVPRIARYPVDLVMAGITDEQALVKAMAGCELVIHAAMGTSSAAAERHAVNVAGTESVLKAAAACGVERVVHLSTVCTYGLTRDGDLDETSRRGRLFDDYSRSKAKGEKIALRYQRRHGVPVVILQPTVVYGPFAGGWTTGPLVALREKQVILPDQGAGLCNAVYIDDVIQAITLACQRPQAVGQSFLIAGQTPVTWKEFYGCYEEMLGEHSTISISEKEVRRLRSPWRQLPRNLLRIALHEDAQRLIYSSALLRIPYRVLRRLIPKHVRNRLSPERPRIHAATPVVKPVQLIDPGWYRWLATKTRVRIEKARRFLGYQPQFGLEQGMSLTQRWAEWAGLLK